MCIGWLEGSEFGCWLRLTDGAPVRTVAASTQVPLGIGQPRSKRIRERVRDRHHRCRAGADAASAVPARPMGGRISPRWTAPLGSGVAKQLLDHPADATTASDGTRDSVKERAALIFFVVELFENAVITRPGDVVGRSLLGRLLLGGDAPPRRSDPSEPTCGG